MVDFRVHDTFGSHPKTLGMTLEAVGAWTLAAVWCSRHLTDGYIPNEAMALIVGKKRAVLKELVDRNLIEPAPGGWQYVDWLQYQRSKAQVQAEREQTRKRLAEWRARQREK
jgi:hypothetical protein